VLIAWVIVLVVLFPLARGLSGVTNGTAAASLPASAPSTRVVQLEQAPGQPDIDTATVVLARGGGLTPADLAAVAAARGAVAGLAGHVQGLGAPGRAQRSPDGQADEFTADVTAPASSQASTDTAAVQAIRGAVSGPASRAGDGLQAAVTGSAAVNADSGVSGSAQDTLLLIPLVLIVIGVIIALLLRAVVAPLVLVAATALSFAAAFGLSSLLWRYGLGYVGIEAQLPMYIFIFLVALGVDYSIFMSARIREEAARIGTRPGIVRGFGVTGGVITAAGIVMTGTFAALAQLPDVSVAEVGTAVALGVLLDTLLVRTVLVPASLLIIGERAWWPTRPAGPGRPPGGP